MAGIVVRIQGVN